MALMTHSTAGSPVSGRLWTRATTHGIAQQLAVRGIPVCDRTVAGLLRQLGYALRVNHKTIASSSPRQRNEQFEKIAAARERCQRDGIPVISVDTKKKELIGRFKNPGAQWCRAPEPVHDHDFRSLADGLAVPYGIYDLHANAGSFCVSCSHDTPQFAAECIAKWWQTQGRVRYPDAAELVILADAGGSNGCRPRAWKYFLQQKLASPFRLQVTILHYPAGASKYNPIEHRLFSEVSKHWAGLVLDSMEHILQYLRSTTTRTGLRVTAEFVDTLYETGIKITDPQLAALNCVKDEHIPQWNYTIKPIADHPGPAAV